MPGTFPGDTRKSRPVKDGNDALTKNMTYKIKLAGQIISANGAG